MTVPPSPSSPNSPSPGNIPFPIADHIIDTQAPLALRSSDRILVADLLAIHMVRASDTSSTIISYHPTPEWQATTARNLHARARYAGRSVYWQNIFRDSCDPTFVLLTLLWYALYSWDESLELMYSHICWLESRVINSVDIHLTRELHILRAHLVHYESLLLDFRKSVLFVLETPNPGMDSPLNQPHGAKSASMMKRECGNLLSEIDRLEMSRRMQDMRLRNVMDLAFSLVNLEDSRYQEKLTEAAVRDSAVMRQINFLILFFLPASFVATVFGMNIEELAPGTHGNLARYFATAIPLTVVTICLVMALHIKDRASDPQASGRSRWWRSFAFDSRPKATKTWNLDNIP